MLWHILAFDVAHLDPAGRAALETELARLEAIPEVLWFHLGRDVERPHITAFVAVFADHDALERYRVRPEHIEVAKAIRASKATSQRLDLDGLPILS
jgi:quinol monooxygenase YgiN